MVGSRLTDEEFEFVELLAKKENVSVGETVAVIVRAYIKEASLVREGVSKK